MGGCSLSSSSSGLEKAAIFMSTAVRLRAEDSGLLGCYDKNSYRRFERPIEREESLLGVLDPDDYR